jgi:hypothetical protein
LTPNSVKKMMIARADKKSNTKGERQFDDYQESRLLSLRHGHAGEGTVLSFYDQMEAKFFDFQCDFLRIRYGPEVPYIIDNVHAYDVDFEIDGKGHKEKWDAWKDALKVAAGLRVIHVPEEITVEEHWPYLDKQIDKALKAKEMVHYIAG